jgi:two-component system sensor histidine kinase PilS (NtrC family)
VNDSAAGITTSDRLQQEQRVAILKIYNYYRILLSFLLLFIFLQPADKAWVGQIDPQLFRATILIYLVVNSAIGIVFLFIRTELLCRTPLIFTLITLDVIALMLLITASGGIGSGLGNFLIFPVAFAGGLIGGRISTVVPAIAFILCIYGESFLFLRNVSDSQSFFQAGVLGTVLFVANILFQYVSKQLRERETAVISLEKLNQTIIDRMRMGVIVVSVDGDIHLINKAARQLLGSPHGSIEEPVTLPVSLTRELAAWQGQAGPRNTTFKAQGAGAEILAQYSRVVPGSDSDSILFLESSTDIQQQAQQMKLAALGRLSASIAHEIRNPLGAISHAAQLLAESQGLDKGDRRLTEIVQDHCVRMNGVIENVLQMSRRKLANPEELDIRKWFDAFLAEFPPGVAGGIRIELKIADDVRTVTMDPVHLTQVLANLCQNGARYSQKIVGEPQVTIEVYRDNATGEIHIDVVDYGRGVEPELVQNLFEPFYTTESTGTGLGLYLSRELCEANHCRLNYHRHELGGSCFRISFVQ